MQKKYPKLFINQGENFENEILLRGKECEDPKLFYILFYFFEYVFRYFTLFALIS